MKSSIAHRLLLVAFVFCMIAIPFALGQQKEADPGAVPAPPKKTAANEEDSKAATADEDIRELKLKDWKPTTMLKTKQTFIDRAAYPVIDVHNHLGGGAKTLTDARVKKYIDVMDAAGVQTVVNLDGMWDETLTETLERLDNKYPGRFLTFLQINFKNIDDEGWTEREVKRMRAGFEAGAKGLKIHKSLGLTYRYKNGKLMPVDDPKLDPLWKLCGEMGKPVMIHSSDPAAFFTPLDAKNERWHELNVHPNWLFHGEKFPPNEEILGQLHRMIKKHPETTFMCAHMGCNAEDLATVGQWLDECPNMMVDIDARISELGRQPYTARKFLIKYQDRVMFGTDTTPEKADSYRIYYRFLETEDEYFDCAASHHLQGFWMIYGVNLPKDVLEKIYRKNALKVLKVPGTTATE